MSASDTKVINNTPLDRYIASSGQTDFDYNFLIYDREDLTVLKTTNVGTDSQNTEKLSNGINQDYTINNTGNEDGGKIVLTSGANDGEIYTLFRNSIIDRKTDLNQDGDFSAEALNLEFDEIFLIAQELQFQLNRTPTLPEQSQLDSIDLPEPESKKAIAWNENGDGLVNVESSENKVNISDNGSEVLTSADDINFSDNLDVINDGDGTVTINATDTNTQLSEEEVDDYVGNLLVGGSNVTLNYDDANDSLTINANNTDTSVDIEDDGTSIVSNASIIDFAGDHFDVTNPSANEISIDLTSGGIDNADLNNSSITVAGNSVSLGGSTTVNHGDLGSISSDQHHPEISISNNATQIVSGPDDINFGSNISASDDGDGSVTISTSGSKPDASDDGSTVITSVSDFNFGTDLSVTDDGDGSVTIDATFTDTDTRVDVTNNDTTVSNAEEILATNFDVSLIDPATAVLELSTNQVGTDALDQSPTYQWENEQKFDASHVIQEIATPTTPINGYNKLYFKSDDNLYALDSDGNENQVGGSSDTRANVSDSGTQVVTDVTDINLSDNLTVTDDGDGSVTIDAAGGGSTDASDNGTLVVSGPSDFNFSDNLTVTDDGDGTVTIDAAGGGSTDASDNGTLVVSGPSDFNFSDNLTVTDDGDGTVTIDAATGSVDISEDDTQVLASISDINFTTSLKVADDGDGTVTVSTDQDLTNTGTPTFAAETLTGALTQTGDAITNVLEPTDVTADGGIKDSPTLTLRAKHDSDDTTSVTSSSTDYTINFNSAVSSGSQIGEVKHSVATNSDQLVLNANGNVEIGQSTGGDSLLTVAGTTTSDTFQLALSSGTAYKDASGNNMLQEVVATGSVALSSGSATVDTGVANTNTATFNIAIAPDTDDADVAADIRSDSGSGNYEVDIEETDTSVGNPTVYYDIIRVR